MKQKLTHSGGNSRLMTLQLKMCKKQKEVEKSTKKCYEVKVSLYKLTLIWRLDLWFHIEFNATNTFIVTASHGANVHRCQQTCEVGHTQHANSKRMYGTGWEMAGNGIGIG